MSKKNKGRGVPVDMSYDDDFSSLGDGYEEHGSGASALSGFSLSLTPPKTSSRSRKQAVKDEAARILEEAKAEKAAQAESDRLYKEYMQLHQPPKPPKSVICALCKKSKTVGDAISHKWKKHPFGFANQAICAECDAATVPFTASPEFVWKREPNMLSAQQARLLKLLERGPPPNELKANIAETAVFDLTPKQREASLLSGMRKQLSAKLLTPPVAEATPFAEAQLAKFTDATYKRNRGGTKSKSKSKYKSKRSKSRSRSRSRF